MTECLFPDCRRPPKQRKPGSRGPAPRYCDDPGHNRVTAHRKRKEVEVRDRLDHLTLGEIRQVLAELTALASPERPKPSVIQPPGCVRSEPAVVVNVTPHPVRIYSDTGVVVREIPASGMVARLKADHVDAGTLDGLPLSRITYGRVEGLSAPEEGVFFLVSLPVALALAGQRDDLLVVDQEVRENGTIVGCRGLARPYVSR